MDEKPKQIRRTSSKSSSSLSLSSSSSSNSDDSETSSASTDISSTHLSSVLAESEIPFSTVHKIPKSFYDAESPALIAGLPINVTIIEVIKDSHYLNPYLYVPKVT
jgi:hypothetical protein